MFNSINYHLNLNKEILNKGYFSNLNKRLFISENKVLSSKRIK